MFRLFRRRRELKPAHFYLDCAAGILQARGKCEGRTHDDWGRVDAVGAMRLAVWGVLKWDDLPDKKNRAAFWAKYDEVKWLMYQYLGNNHPSDLFRKDRSYMNANLQVWSDMTPQRTVVEWMRKAAWEAKHADRS